MKLSILIPTLNEPESINYLHRLNNILDPQIARYPGQVEKRIHDGGRYMPTGTKRNELIKNSDGEYFVFIDCDDTVPMYYVDEMMAGIEQNPDVISFRGHMTTNGNNQANFVIRLGEKYEERKGVYYRYPNHICCFKRSVVQSVRFPDVWVQEDYIYATEIMKRKLLKTEFYIDKFMYLYDFKTNKPQYQNARFRR